MASIITTIADAVVTELNAAPARTFSQAIKAARHYTPVHELKDLTALKVSVVPRGVESKPAGRNSVQLDVSIDIAVQKRIAGEDDPQAAADGLMALVEEIIGFFHLRRLSACGDAIWTATANEPIFAPDHIRDMGLFTSVITLTFRVIRNAR